MKIKSSIFLLVALGLSVFTSCEKKNSDEIVISGKIENAQQKEILVGTEDGMKVDTIHIDENGNFNKKINDINGYGLLAYGQAIIPIYLEKDGDLEIYANENDFGESFSYTSGSLKESNIFLKKNNDKIQQALQSVGIEKLFLKEEDDFIKFTDSLENAYANELEKANLPQSFVDAEKKKVHYNLSYWHSVYPDNHKYIGGKEDYQPSEKFKQSQKKIEYNNLEDYKIQPIYRRLVKEHYLTKLDEAKDKEQRRIVLEEVKNSPIKELSTSIAYYLMPNVMQTREQLEENEENIHFLTEDKEIIAKLEESLEKVKKLAQGSPSPSFSYESIEGKTVSLSDLKGNLVYIDVWATWCGPCKGEIPYLQKLEEDYKGKAITFVSLSIDKDKDAWEKMVKEKNLGGIQLFADKEWKSKFVLDYEITGIPRFILLDKEGNIISANAPRPSNEMTRTLIDEWIMK